MTGKKKRPPVVLGYNQKEGRWFMVINRNQYSSLHLKCSEGVDVERAIREAMGQAYVEGIRWHRSYADRARSLAVDLGLAQQGTPTER